MHRTQPGLPVCCRIEKVLLSVTVVFSLSRLAIPLRRKPFLLTRRLSQGLRRALDFTAQAYFILREILRRVAGICKACPHSLKRGSLFAQRVFHSRRIALRRLEACAKRPCLRLALLICRRQLLDRRPCGAVFCRRHFPLHLLHGVLRLLQLRFELRRTCLRLAKLRCQRGGLRLRLVKARAHSAYGTLEIGKGTEIRLHLF